MSFYYNVIIGWSFYYLGGSFSGQLPWNDCNNTWNTDYCMESCHDDDSNLGNATVSTSSMNVLSFPCNMSRSPAKEYFK